jgi:eukaryotic-like serine/threonine-protein kinase
MKAQDSHRSTRAGSPGDEEGGGPATEAGRRQPRDRLIGGTLDGRYRVERRIGSGGMSIVYLAFDETLERPVAIKVLDSDISRDPNALERFRREARTVAQISHPHVVMVIDAGEDQGHPYIVFEHVRGETLKDRIRREGPLPVSEAVAYAIEIGRALEAAHDRQLVHRDVKPQNVLIDEEGRAKVTDFGIARSLELGAHQLTAAGRVVGTTDYVSPEQALGNEVTGSSDVYSLGIVLYEMLTGEVPFKGENNVSVAMKHVRESLPDVQQGRPEISAALAAVVERATAKDAAARYTSAKEMVHDLEEVLAFEAARAGGPEGEATAVLNQLQPELAGRGRRRRAWRMPLYVLLALLLAAGAALAVRSFDSGGGKAPVAQNLSAIQLGDRNAFDYDPAPGDGQENPEMLGALLDGERGTVWETENYSTPELGNIKDGVGVYLDAGSQVVARALRATTPRPGWSAELYVANSVPDSVSGWTKVGLSTVKGSTGTLNLDTGGRRFRYYLVWITRLAQDPGGQYSAAISELRLLG